jgi:hypothetical protein
VIQKQGEEPAWQPFLFAYHDELSSVQVDPTKSSPDEPTSYENAGKEQLRYSNTDIT